jgi:hypothetical protein
MTRQKKSVQLTRVTGVKRVLVGQYSPEVEHIVQAHIQCSVLSLFSHVFWQASCYTCMSIADSVKIYYNWLKDLLVGVW